MKLFIKRLFGVIVPISYLSLTLGPRMEITSGSNYGVKKQPPRDSSFAVFHFLLKTSL